MLRQEEELGGIPDEQRIVTVSLSSYIAVGYSQKPALVDVVVILSERPTETAGRASVLFSNGR